VTGRAKIRRKRANKSRNFLELSVPSVRHPIEVERGILPAGTKATVVSAYRDGRGQEIKIPKRFHVVVTPEAAAA